MKKILNKSFEQFFNELSESAVKFHPKETYVLI